MSDISIDAEPKTGWRPTYFVSMALLIVFFAFGGFGITYFFPMVEGTFRDVRPAVHIHGMIFFAWTLVLLLQTSLVASDNRALHRTVGMAGISLATAVVIFGVIVSMQTEGGLIARGEILRGYGLGFSSLTAMAAFGTMFALAIKNLRRLDYHKRWILMATCNILAAPVNRILSPFFDGPTPIVATFLVILVIPATCLIYDMRTRGRPHIVTLIGIAVLSIRLLGTLQFTTTEVWHNTFDTLLLLMASS
jgi:hypothetical protein